MFRNLRVLRVAGCALRNEYRGKTLLSHTFELGIDAPSATPVRNSFADSRPHVYLRTGTANHGLGQRHRNGRYVESGETIHTTRTIAAHRASAKTSTGDCPENILSIVEDAEELSDVKDEWVIAHADEGLHSGCTPNYTPERSLGRRRRVQEDVASPRNGWCGRTKYPNRLSLSGNVDHPLNDDVLARISAIVDLELVKKVGSQRIAWQFSWNAERIDVHHHHHSSGIVRIGEKINVGDVAFWDRIHNRSLAMVSRMCRGTSPRDCA